MRKILRQFGGHRDRQRRERGKEEGVGGVRHHVDYSVDLVTHEMAQTQSRGGNVSIEVGEDAGLEQPVSGWGR